MAYLACLVLRYHFWTFQALIHNVEDGDVDKYTEEIQNYDSISRKFLRNSFKAAVETELAISWLLSGLDSWYTTLLLRVKKQISASDLL